MINHLLLCIKDVVEIMLLFLPNDVQFLFIEVIMTFCVRVRDERTITTKLVTSMFTRNRFISVV